MPIPFRHDWADNLPPAKIYPLGARDRKVVNDTFEPLHAAGKMQYTTQPTPFGFPVFVTWKKVPDPKNPGAQIDKGHAVVDLRGTNKILLPDSYQIPLQSDLFASLRSTRYISTMDALSFFYQ